MRERNCLLTDRHICSVDLISLYSLRYKQINAKCFPGVKSLIELILLNGDRFYQQRLSLYSTYICSNHLQDTSKEYSVSSYRKCWLCASLNKPLPVRFYTTFFSLNMLPLFFCLRTNQNVISRLVKP